MSATEGYTFFEPLNLEGSRTGEFYNELLRGLAHKLNNQLAVIQGFSSLILMNDGLDSSTKENLDHMKDAALGAGRLSDRVLSAGGCARISLQEVDLAGALPMMESDFKKPCETAGVPCKINVAAGLPKVQADLSRLKEALIELITNAAEAAADKSGEVSVDVFAPGQVNPGSPMVDIFVRNTGDTLSPEKIVEAFVPFTTTRDSDHYGIGLTSAGVLCGMMGMKLGMKSADGITTAWIQVPTAA